MSDLRATSVSQCLDKKLIIFGFEIPDVLAIFLTLSILNLIFGPLDMRILCVWLPTAALAVALRVSKRGKPDNYLVHLLRYHMRPKALWAFADPTHDVSPPYLQRSEQ